VDNAHRRGIVDAILVGNKSEICRIADKEQIDLTHYSIVHEADRAEACRRAVGLVAQGQAELPMKGFVDTSVFLKAVLRKDGGLACGRLISHVGLLAVKGYKRMFLVTDSAMNIAPTLAEKAAIIRNAVMVARALGNDCPRVAALCAVEKPDPKMPATLDAAALTEMNRRGEIAGCMVYGPLAMDNAVSPQAAKHKGIDNPVAGHADILLAPDIEAGNILNKSMEYFAAAEKAGIIMGARVPVVLTSRASPDAAKMHSIALAVLTAAGMKTDGDTEL
jgi:Phosphotransacetylase